MEALDLVFYNNDLQTTGLSITEEQHREGGLMDFYTFGVYRDKKRLGTFHFIDAVTFQDAVYIGEHPQNAEQTRLEAHRIMRDHARFDGLHVYSRQIQLRQPDL